MKINGNKKGYSLDNMEDILAITKILLESRTSCKGELKHLTNYILGQVDNKQRKYIKEIIGNELLIYIRDDGNEHFMANVKVPEAKASISGLPNTVLI